MLICFQREASACVIESAEGTRIIDFITLVQVEKQKCSKWLNLFPSVN